MDIAHDYVGNFQRLEDVLPYRQYNSGARDDNNAITRNPAPENTNPVLLLEFDILNDDGFGLKRGFYEIRPDDDYTCLMFIQAGKIAAKIPVISHESISTYGSNYEWPDAKRHFWEKKSRKNEPPPPMLTEKNTVVSPKKITPVFTEKEAKRRDYKYKKGIDPTEHIHSEVKMHYDKELKLYVVVWEKYNTRVTGVIKTE